MITNPHQKKRRSVSELQDYLMIAVGMLLGSIGWVVFLLPNNITTGGLPGISSILYWGLGIPVQVSYFVLNAILLAIALKVMGWRFCIKTIYAVVLFTMFTSIFEPMARNSGFLSDQPFMAAVVGACFLGMTSGMGLYSGGSTGGSDLIAAMVNKYHDISLGRVILICDLIIITSSYFVLRSWEQVIYGYVVLFISAFCVDRFINSMRSSVQFFIISDKYEEIANFSKVVTVREISENDYSLSIPLYVKPEINEGEEDTRPIESIYESWDGRTRRAFSYYKALNEMISKGATEDE